MMSVAKLQKIFKNQICFEIFFLLFRKLILNFAVEIITIKSVKLWHDR